MSSEVWYRKWRPQRFGEVAGQEHITRTLANAVAAGRVAHAYLFCGPRGTGKTSTARILAKAVNCRQNEAGEPCNHCVSCRDVAEGRALDLVEMDAASNRGIDEIRSLRDRVGYSPTSSAYKVYLIDEVHELTAHAFDALLKTLEEPPPHAIFVLATTEADRVPATVASRCQRHDFRRIRVRDVVARLRQICAGEAVELTDEALEFVARRATGSLRDAVNLLEQAVAASGPRPSLTEVQEALGAGGEEAAATVVRCALARDLARAFAAIAAARDEGIEPRRLQRAALRHLRALMLVKAGAEASLELGDEAVAELREQAEPAELALLLRMLRLLSAADFRSDSLSPLPIELALAEALLPSVPESSGSAPQRTLPKTPPERPAASARTPAAAAGPETPSRPRPVTAQSPPFARAAPPPRQSEAPALAPQRDIGDEPDGGAPPLRGGEVTVERLQGLMGTIYDRLKERRSRASALINSHCNVVELDTESITLAFRHDFLAARVKSEEGGRHIQDIEEAIESVSGRRLRLRISVDPDVQRWARPPATARTSHLLDEAEKLGLRRE